MRAYGSVQSSLANGWASARITTTVSALLPPGPCR